MEPIINAFHIDYKIIIAQAVNFAIVFFVLYKFAFKPLNKLMAERGEKIQKGLDDAKTNEEILKNTKVEYDKMISEAKSEAHKIFQDGKKEAEDKRTEMLEKTKEEVALMIENGKKNLENEKAKMMSETKGEIASLAIKMTEKIIGEKLNGTFNEKTIEELNNL